MYTVRMKNAEYMKLWDELLTEMYCLHKETGQNGKIFKASSPASDERTISVTITLHMGSNLMHVQGKDNHMYMKSHFKKLSHCILNRITDQTSTKEDHVIENETATPRASTPKVPKTITDSKTRRSVMGAVKLVGSPGAGSQDLFVSDEDSPCSPNTTASEPNTSSDNTVECQQHSNVSPVPQASIVSMTTEVATQVDEEVGIKYCHSSQTQTDRLKMVSKETQTPKAKETTAADPDLKREMSELKKELEATKQLLKKTEIALAFTRERLAKETAGNMVYQEDFAKVSDQIS